MFAENVMSTQILVLQLEGDISVRDAVVLLESSGFHELPVVDAQGKPVGLVSARSILHLALPGYAEENLLRIMKAGPDIDSIHKNMDALLERPVEVVMEGDIEVVKLDTPTSAVAAILVNLQGDSRNVLVVNEAGALVGTITARDLVCRRL